MPSILLWGENMKTFIKSCIAHDILGMSAKSAYYLLFAFFPLMSMILITLNSLAAATLDFTIPNFALEMAESMNIPAASLLLLLLPVARGIYELKIGIRKIYGKRKIRFREAYLSAILTLGAWILATKGFGVYMENFNNFSSIYGEIGSFLALALWLFVISFTLFLSSEINAHRLNLHKNSHSQVIPKSAPPS